MFYLYLVLSAVAIPFLNNFFAILKQAYSWWLVPVLILGIFLSLVILHIAVIVIWVLTVDFNKPYKYEKAFRKMAKISIPLLMKLVRVSVNVEGAEKVPTDRKLLFICNHQHDFDPVMLLSAFPDFEISFIGKKEIYTEMKFFAKAMHGLHCLPIDRENDRAAAKTIIEAARLLKEDKQSIGLFPEGYTSKTCELLPFRNGSFKIAYRSDSPIVVCVMNNTREIVKRMFLRHTTVELRVLDVIYPEDYKNLSTVELGEKLHGQMKAELHNLRN